MFCNHRKEITEIKEAISQIKSDQFSEHHKLQNEIIKLRREGFQVIIKQSSLENAGVWHRFSDVKPIPGKRYLVAYENRESIKVLLYCCIVGWTENGTESFFRSSYWAPRAKDKDIFWIDLSEEVKNLPWNTNDAS